MLERLGEPLFVRKTLAYFVGIAILPLFVPIGVVSAQTTEPYVVLTAPYENGFGTGNGRADPSTGELIVYGAQSVLLPLPYRSTAGITATHVLSSPVSSINYTVNLHVDAVVALEAGSEQGIVGNVPHSAYADVDVVAKASWSCAACASEVRVRLADTILDSTANQEVIVSFTLQGPVPAGPVRVDVWLEAFNQGSVGAAVLCGCVWFGAGTTAAAVTVTSIEGRFAVGEPTPTYSLELSPPSQAGTVAPGGTTSYQLAVTNTGTQQQTVSLTSSGSKSGWSSELSAGSLTIAAGDSATLTLTVNAGNNGSLTVTIVASSDQDASIEASATVRTTVEK